MSLTTIIMRVKTDEERLVHTIEVFDCLKDEWIEHADRCESDQELFKGLGKWAETVVRDQWRREVS